MLVPTALSFLIAAITLCGAATSLFLTHASLEMNRTGFSSSQIGLVHAVHYTSGLVLGAYLPRFIAYTGLLRTFFCALLISAISINLHRWADSIYTMAALRFFCGMSFGTFFSVIESWINGIAPEKRRALIASSYCALLVGGFSFGSWMRSVLPNSDTVTYIVITTLLGFAAPLMAGAKNSAPIYKPKSNQMGFCASFKAAALVILTTAFFGMAETAILTMLPVYGVKMGLAENTAARLTTAFMAGGMMMLVPTGLIADRINKTRMLIFLLTVSGFTGLFLQSAVEAGEKAAYILLFAWGAVTLAIYPLLMAMLGSRVERAMLASVTTVMVVAYNIGSALGPLALGYLMKAYGTSVFAYGIAFALLFNALLAIRRVKAEG